MTGTAATRASAFPSRMTAEDADIRSAPATHFTPANDRRFSSVTSASLRPTRTPDASKRKTVRAPSFAALSSAQSRIVRAVSGVSGSPKSWRVPDSSATDATAPRRLSARPPW